MDHSYSNIFNPNFKQLYHNNVFTDVKIIVGKDVFNCHRIILAGSSGYFYAMLTGEFKEKCQSEICLQEIDPAAAAVIFSYCYGNPLDFSCLTLEALENLYALALQWDVQVLTSQLHAYIKSLLSTANCCKIAAFAEYHSKNLLNDVLIFICQNMLQLIQGNFLSYLSCDLLIKVIESDFTLVRHEDIMIDAINLWIEWNRDERQHYLIELLSHIRLPYVSWRALHKLEMTYGDMVQNSTAYLKLILQAKNHDHFPELYFDEFSKPRRYYNNLVYWNIEKQGNWSTAISCPSRKNHEYNVSAKSALGWSVKASSRLRKGFHYVIEQSELTGLVFGHIILLMGGIDIDDQMKDNAVIVNTRLNRNPITKSHLRLPQSMVGFAACRYKDTFYIFGGSSSNSQSSSTSNYSNQVWKYNTITRDWQRMTDMIIARRKCQATVVDDYIYVIGGITQHGEIASKAERYDPATNTWKLIENIDVEYEDFRIFYIQLKLIIFSTASSYRCFEQLNSVTWEKIDISETDLLNYTVMIDGHRYITDGFTAAGYESYPNYGFLIPEYSCYCQG